ncbi:putative protein kinase [Leishmania braziliensis MHOM/BR/75/M2904]|uniref:non-specific serine/threonine protein kinase n=2 Tax=Leishmania braziliensis TaxID=5660 RepID=A4HMQ6_LEIBR|nr:putative protein kinase [Leishmania braziliensis MHOM/BR/75/M2904]KAI5689300.1 Protein kinase domain [Leishmania braziliensis]CAJ2480303.1 unnamed protein product [Leishmania braziliensis]CAM43444.1 putative protein kinase [Leishmania braziliensis MHOM/BR/75/M2904]SYZ69516.1 protein_kinase [Leishmania braziliensis MHOM/BR/75/M2904]
MSKTRGKVDDHVKSALPAITKAATSFPNAADTTVAASKMSDSSRDGHNPLIDDLFNDLGQNFSIDDFCGVGYLHGKSISNNGSFASFDPELRRASEESETSSRSSPRTRQFKAAAEIICQVGQHFVHAMRMHELDTFFCPASGENTADALRRQLRTKNQQEVETVVVTLVELLETVRKEGSHVAPLAGALSELDGIGRSRAFSTSMISGMSTASLMRPPVYETNQLDMAYDQQGNRMINCYRVIANLGRGAYGKVKLGIDTNTDQMVAIKMIDKKFLKKKIGGLGANNQEAALKREIAIMKKVRHRNCVSLYEVIDDPDSHMLYLIMEYVPNGPVVRLKPHKLGSTALKSIEAGIPLSGEACNKVLMRCAVRQSATGGSEPLTDAEIASNPTVFFCKPLGQHICALYLRQLVSGLRYMHKRNLVHHDIKPDNILLGTDHQVFLTDFGVSEILSTRQEMKDAVESNHNSKSDDGSSDYSSRSLGSDSTGGDRKGDGGGSKPRLGGGTLLFTAPELFDGSVNQHSLDPHLTDVWALGATLYCMLVGMPPFFGNSYAEVRTNVLTQAYPWCGKTMYETLLATEWRVVLNGLLAKDPTKRWSLAQLKSFLDQESFQDTMRQSAFHEASLGTRSSTCLDGDTFLSSSTAQRTTGLVMPLSDATPVVAPGPSPECLPMANGSNIPFPPHVVPSAARVSALPVEPGGASHSFLRDFSVSEQEVRDATRTVKVEVRRQSIVLSAPARAIVCSYVKSIRAGMQGRSSIQLSCSSPFGSIAYVGSPSSVKMHAGANKISKMSTSSGETEHVTQAPSVAAEVRFRHSSEAGPISATSLFYPPRRSSRISAVTTRTGKQSEGGGGGRALAGGSAEGCVVGRPAQPLDAAFSIVNLQSNAAEYSPTLSRMSSSASSRHSFLAQRAPGGHHAGREANNENGTLTRNSATPSGDTRVLGSGTADTASWFNAKVPSTVAQTMLPESVTPSLIDEGDDRQGVDDDGDSSRFSKLPGCKKTPCGTLLSNDGGFDQVTLTPGSRSVAPPLLNSVLYSATSGVGDSDSGGYRSTSPNPNTVSTPGAFLAMPSEKSAFATRSPGWLGLRENRYPIQPLQHRLSEGKLVAPALTAFEEVLSVARSERRATVNRK